MGKVKIVTDSSCTMEKNTRDRLNIQVMSLSVLIDDRDYQDAEALSGEKFMEMMASAKKIPQTSQPPIGKFIELYDELGKDGSEIISIHMTHGLSGTVETARQAAELSNSRVTVLDSDTTDQGLSFQVIRAAELAAEGLPVSEILTAVNEVKEKTKLYIGISTLDNLVKGGRISRATGLLSHLLNIKVVMDFYHSELIPVIKGRGAKTFMKWFGGLKKELIQLSNVAQIGISYAGSPELANEFKEILQQLFPEMNIPVLHTTPIIATHTGKNAFAITFYTK